MNRVVCRPCASARALALVVCFVWSGLAWGQTTYRSIPMDCGGWFSGLAIHSSGRLYGFGDVFGMWRSDNAGQSWQYLQGDFTDFDHFINGCDVATGSADRVVFINGASATNSKLFTSADGGATWATRLTDLIPRRDRGATPVVFHPANDNEIWLASARTGSTGSLWRSLNGGANWSKMGGSTFDGVVATTVYIRPEFPDQIWVGAAGGLYVSADRGVSFTRVWSNAGGVAPLNGAIPTVVAIARRADGVGYMATNSKGWRITASDYNNPATYSVTATNSWWSGWGPNNATVLADGSFVTNTADDNLSISSDGGQSWVPLGMRLVTPPIPPWTVAAGASTRAPGGRDMIVQDPTNPARWFMTGGKSPVITTDSGATWKYPPNINGLAGVKTYKPRFPRGAPDMAVIPCSDQGVFTVTDAGLSGGVATCARASIDEHFTFHEVLTSDDGQTLIAAGNEQATNRSVIIRSTNGGASWSKLDLTNSGLPLSYEGITRAVAAPGSTTDFLVLLGYNSTSPSTNNPGLYRTTNGGVSFAKVSGIPDGVNTGQRYHHEYSWLETDGVNLNARYLSLRAENNAAARGFWRSGDGGSTWAMTPNQPYGPSSWIDCMAVDRATAGRVWVGNGSLGLRRSDDGGNNWSTVGNFTNVTRVDAAYGRVAVWGRQSGDTWNKIYYSRDNGATWSEKTGPGHRFAYVSDLAVDPNRAGQIWVAGNSIDLINPPAAPTAPAPATPTNFAVALSGTQANLSWADNASDETGYAIEVRVGSATTFSVLAITGANATAYAHSGLLDGVTYAYRVRALKTADNVASAYTPTLSVSPPATTLPLVPTAPIASAVSTSQILFSWADNAYNETGYQVERSTLPDSGFTLLGTTAAGATSYSDTGLGEGVRFYYRVRAVNGLGVSAYATVVAGVTAIATPTNLVVTATSSRAVSLSWADNTTVETGYAIERSLSSGEGFVEIASTAASATTYTDASVVSGTTYYYRVRARNAVAVSDYAAEVTAVASNYQPPAFYEPFNYSLSPSSIVGRAFSGTGNSGAWSTTDSVVQDTLLAGNLAAGRLPGVGNQIRLPNTPAFGTLDLALGDATLALMNPPAAGSRTFWVSLLARSPNTLSTRSSFLALRTQTGYSPISLYPFDGANASYALQLGGSNRVNSTGGAVVANTTYLYVARITVSDTDGDNTNGFERFEGRIWQYPASSLPPLSEPTSGGVYRSPLSGTSSRITQLQLVSGCSSASDSKFAFDEIRIGATYAQVALPPPSSAPTNLSFTNITSSGATLVWVDNASDETGFKVQRAASASGPFTDIATLGANVTSYADSGLTAGVEYFYRVYATSSSGDSDFAAGSFVTTSGAVTAVAYDFNSSQANFESTFNETSGWGALWSASAGAGGGGGLATDSNDRAALLPTALTTFTNAGQRVALSVAFKARVTAGATNTAGGEGLRLGFNLVNTPLLASGGYLTAGINEATSNSLPSSLVVDSRNNVAGSTVISTDSNAVTLVDNEWYRVDATFTYNGADSFTVAVTLYGLGASGSSTPVALDTYTLTRTGLTSLVNAPVYVGFQGKSSGGFGGVRAFDSFSASVQAPTPPVITGNQSANGTVGTAFSYQVQASNSPTSYALAGGSLPAGVTLNATTGLLSGTPSASGTFSPSFTATNGSGTSPAVNVSVSIAEPAGVVSFRSAQGLAADGSQDLLSPAGDGVANLLKYAFNMIGTGAGQAWSVNVANGWVLVPGGSAGLPYVGMDPAGKLQITYIRRKASGNPGISYGVEFSDELSSWGPNALATESVTSIDATFERVTLTDSLVSPLKRFVRVKVTLP